MKATKVERREPASGYDKAAILKICGLAVVLGLGTWLLTPLLFPVKVPDDFPKPPNLQTVSPALRSSLENADREARRRPGSAELVGKLGIAYHANQYPEQAAQAYRIAARLAPGDGQWSYCQAYLEEENGNEKEQLRLLGEAVKAKPDHAPALVKLADAYLKLDRLDESAHYYELAAKTSWRGAALPANFGLARVAARRQQWNKVVEIATPLTREYSYVLPPYELLQEAFEKLGQPGKALEARQSASVTKWKIVPPPDDPLSDQLAAASFSSTRLLKQAGLLSRLGSPDRALEVARRAEQADPTDPAVPNFMAHTLLTFFGGQPAAVDEALTQLSTCLRLRPDDLVPLWSFTDEFFKSPKPPAAVERLSTLLMPHAREADAHYALALLADARGNAPEAIAQYQAALRNKPTDSAVYNKLGQIYDGQGKFAPAITNFERSVQLDPMNMGARLNLGVALMQSGNYGGALKALEELLRYNPHDAAANFCAGYALLYSKRIDESIARFRDGLRYKPDDAEAHYGLASALLALRRKDEAVAELQAALKYRPGFPPAQELLQQLSR